MLRYFKRYLPDGRMCEVSYEEALNSVLGTFRDNDMSRDMLTIPNNILCRYCTIYVEEQNENGMNMVLMAGLYNQLPMDTQYDDDGNRV